MDFSVTYFANEKDMESPLTGVDDRNPHPKHRKALSATTTITTQYITPRITNIITTRVTKTYITTRVTKITLEETKITT